MNALAREHRKTSVRKSMNRGEAPGARVVPCALDEACGSARAGRFEPEAEDCAK
jgi:hypothetical protein